MTPKRYGRLYALLMAVVLLLSSTGSFLPLTAEAATRTELENQLKNLQAQEKKIKNDLAAASSDLSASKKRKGLLDSQIENATQQISLLEQQLTELNSSIQQKTEDISAAEIAIQQKETEIRETHELLGQRLRAIAKSGNLSGIQRLLNTENYTEYLLKSKAAECIARRDQQTMDRLEAALKEIQAQKATLEQQKADVESEKASVQQLKKDADSKKKELDTLYAAVQTEIRKLQSSVSSYNSDLKETQKKIAEADAAIEALIKSTASTGRYDQNMMYWPIPTVRAISSYYGPRWGTQHRGLDIANGPIPVYGENIVAAADGVVIAVNSTSRWGTGWSYGYGYCVIIDHGVDSKGRTIHTMYAHCSAMYAKEGQKVTGGKTVIAKAGNTGNVTGPHLHFEVRVDGERVNPYPNYVHPNVN
ncbi:MAG: peptidoglycan DD-metalloendopeptidase family protein [Clostridia bacterium]|nr:peptidoglycan DD-metalloendopeptidase family protein [Clostridia bacterium]